MSESTPVQCDQCNAAVICGQPCHEQGCPNMYYPWMHDVLANVIRPMSESESIEEFEEADEL